MPSAQSSRRDSEEEGGSLERSGILRGPPPPPAPPGSRGLCAVKLGSVGWVWGKRQGLQGGLGQDCKGFELQNDLHLTYSD